MTRLWRSFCSNEGREKRQPLLNATMRKLTRRPAAKAQVLFKIWKGKKKIVQLLLQFHLPEKP